MTDNSIPRTLAAFDSAKTQLMSHTEQVAVLNQGAGEDKTLVDPRSSDRHVGRNMGGFRLVRKLAEGGMGAVYLAIHAQTGARAAVKVLLPELASNQTVVRRFFNEATAANAIEHAGIVRVHGSGYDEHGNAFIAMEYLDGDSLEQRLARERAFPVARALGIARQIADILAVAHRTGIVHRDLKPDNIMLVEDARAPGGERVVLLDFGIAKLVASDAPLTRIGDLMGTPAYMAPEQCRARLGIDHRADLYALGCLLFRMVCGRPPFDGANLGEVLVAQIQNPPPRPRDLAPHIPEPLEALILALLEKTPAARPTDATTVMAALDAMGAPRPAGTPPVGVPVRAMTPDASSVPVPRAILGAGSAPNAGPNAPYDAGQLAAQLELTSRVAEDSGWLSWRVGLAGICLTAMGVLAALVVM